MTALTEIKGTGAPLHRALAEQGITELEQLAGADFQKLLALHGVGLKGLNRINDALGEKGLEPMSGVVAPKATTRTIQADVKTKPSERETPRRSRSRRARRPSRCTDYRAATAPRDCSTDWGHTSAA